jgi:Domain of unknown function (DUF4440)
MNITQETVIRRAQYISQLWRAASWDELARCFSDEIIQVGPHLKELSRGRPAAIDSYRAFMNGAKLLEYHEENFRSDIWPSFAIAIYEWRMKYTTDGERRFSSGSDQFIFQESAGELIAVWRYVDFWEDKADI